MGLAALPESWGVHQRGSPRAPPREPGLHGGTSQRESITLPVLKVVLMLVRAGCPGGLEKRELSKLKRTFVRSLHTLTGAKK